MIIAKFCQGLCSSCARFLFIFQNDYAASFAVNVEAPFRICRAAIPLMAEAGGGAIVNIASCWGVHPGPNHPVYCMSKAAIASMTQCLGHDHARQGIRVNAVNPGVVVTKLHLNSGMANTAYGRFLEHSKTTHPLGRVGQAEEVADLIVFLASDSAGWITGVTYGIDGGRAQTCAR